MARKDLHKGFYRPIEILPTRGRAILNAVKALALLSYALTGRKLGLWRVVRFLNRFFRIWAECPVLGPDNKPLLIDLRGKGFGLVTQGFGVTEIIPLMNCLHDGAVILDIGANVGVWARLFADRVPKGTVYAFEPSPWTFRLLRMNCSTHRNIVCLQLALSGDSGEVGFDDDAVPVSRHIAKSGRITVRSSTLDDWVRDARPTRLDFVKLDIEGFEEELLSKAMTTLQNFKPAVLFEFMPHLTEQRSRFKGRMIFATLRGLGYRLYRLDKSGVLYEDFVVPADWTNDYLAVHAESDFGTHLPLVAGVATGDETTGGTVALGSGERSVGWQLLLLTSVI